ncbi:MAG: AgmX/PglI C-terminal domain-containing protein [Sandaracinaceae bacterium]|nr:AgmX/PglI C-terminal domain-containing protein [Sandaracinaceae bacterium]
MRHLLPVLVLCLAGCASAPTPAPITVAHARPRTEASVAVVAEEEAPPPRPTMAIAGLTGSLTTREAHRALDPRMETFAGCFHEHGTGVTGLGGDVTLHIIVNADGSVRTAFPTDSTVGHRDVERCLSDVAQATVFPRPRGGGEAVLTWPISMDPPSDVRHPQTWDPSRVANVVERRGSDVLAACRPEGTGHVRVTAYTRGGRVIMAGASTDDESGRDALDCVVTRVRSWPMPPTPRTAKVTFEL